MRLIDADILKDMFEGDPYYSSDLPHINYLIDRVIEKRKVGHWIDKECLSSGEPVVECSSCGSYFCDKINNHHFMYHFCPNCGADMRRN